MGIYTALEDKWYDFVDWVDKYIPVAGVIDSVDRVVPSFILFLALLILFLVGIFVLVFSGAGGTGVSFQAEVTVLSKQGAPVPQALISFSQDCAGLNAVSLKTDSSGKATFRACSDLANVQVSKEGYSTLSQDISFEDKKAKLYLSQLVSSDSQRVINVKVKDSSSRTIIVDSKVYVLCVKGGNIDTNLIENGNQSSSGYLINLPSGCDSIQIKAVAEGYDEEKETIGLNEENKTFLLEKTSLNGTVVFDVDSNSGKKDAILTITDELGKEETIIVDSTGFATDSYAAGTYSYVATLYGVQKSGTFTVTTGNTTEVKIYFDTVTAATVAPILGGTAPGVYLKILDKNSAISGAEVRLFYKKSNDVNYLTKLNSSYSGIVGHYPVSDYNNREFYAIVKYLGYETQLVKVTLKTSSESPQEVTLVKGGANLSVKVIDDVNAAVKGAVVSLKKSDFGAANFEEPLVTDANGQVIFKSLPKGYYSIKGVSTTLEGSLDSVSVSADKEVVLTIITGVGTVRFNLLDPLGEKLNAYCELYEKDDDEDLLISSMTTVSNYFQVTSIKAKKNVYLSVPDTNYIPTESPVVTVKRGTQNRNVVLYKQSGLPNDNKVQMFLEGIYNSNPWTTTESKSTKLLAGEKYYVLFTLIANNDTNLNTTVNVFASPKDKNTIDANTMLYMEDAFSTRASIVQTSLTMNSSIIPYDPLTPSNPEHAKQINVYFGEKEGLFAMPVLVEISVDANAKGDTTLYWEGIAGDNKSILYSKEFTIGQTFCFGLHECPELLFSNYVKRQDSTDWIPVEDYSTLQIGDLYDLNVVVENLTDKEIGSSYLSGKIKSTSQAKLLFENDANSVKYPVTVSQLDKNWAGFVLEPLAASPTATVVESLEKGTELKDYKGNNAEIKFNVKVKEDINMQIIATNTANTIYADSEYPMFYIKTFYKSNRLPAVTVWDATVEGESFSLGTGTTDENGEWLGQMDFSGLKKGTVIVFTAHDTNNSNPATLKITLTEAFGETEETVPECISVKIGGTDILTMEIPTVSAEVGGSQGSFTIDSNCTEDRDILIKSDLGVNVGNKFKISPNQTISVILDDPAAVVNSRNGLLGAYPMQIMQIEDKSKFNQVGFIDVIVTDSTSVFSIANPILDMRKGGSASSAITNRGYTGRLDIYYPQMDISTNSVGLNYTKPGIPETIDFTAVVKSHGVEAITNAYMYGSEIMQSNRKNKCHSKTSIVTPSELNFTDLAQDFFDNLVEEFNDKITSAEAVTTPDASDRDPTKSFYDLPVPIQEKIVSELYATSGTVTSISTAPALAENTNKALLKSGSGSSSSNLYDVAGSAAAMSPYSGEVLETIPEMAGSVNNSSCDDIASLGAGCSSGTCASAEDGEAYDNEFREEDYYDDSDEGTYGSECSKCEINYKRIRVDPKLPEGFDGTTANGIAVVDPATLTGESVDVTDGSDTSITSDRLFGSKSEIVNINGDNIWTEITENVLGRLKVLTASGCSPCHILYFGDWIGGLYTKGKKESWLHSVSGGLWGSGGSTARLYTQDEYMHLLTFYNERVSTWSKKLSFTPKEGTVVRLDKYEYKIDPKWMNTDEVFTDDDVSEYNDKNVALEEMLVVPHGLVPFSVASELEDGYSAPDPTNTLVEYRNNGLIYAELQADSIPKGVRAFLKDGYIYAEYIGADKNQAGDTINFTVSKVNLQGSEYAVITVRDWVNGVKTEKIFQVKLLANPTNCYSSDGVAGLTGSEFAPRLLFNWDWNGITYDQCDSMNPNYTYCDATQFTISMFKRLAKIDDAMQTGNSKVLPQYTSFYAYLIKDNYSSDFLKDFDYYYSTTILSSNAFNSTSDAVGYDKFITENRLDYNLKTGSSNVASGNLSKGGLYRVEIAVVPDNESLHSLFSQDKTNAAIHVTFTLIKQAPNYNLFYETPFDGGVGKQSDGTFSRKGYGVSLSDGEIPLTTSEEVNSIAIRNYSGTPLIPLNYVTSTDLGVLTNKTIFDYTDNGENGKTFAFYPMQPTPIVLRIKDVLSTTTPTARDILAPYDMEGDGAAIKTNREWTMISSTLGKSGKCTDFLGNQTYVFDENTNGAQKYFLWQNATKSGTIELATVFFTPPSVAVGSIAKAKISAAYSSNLKLLTVAGSPIAGGSGVQLSYYDSSDYDKYKSVEGILKMVAEGKLCVSQSAAQRLQVWWNQDYLNELLDSVAYNKSNSCAD